MMVSHLHFSKQGWIKCQRGDFQDVETIFISENPLKRRRTQDKLYITRMNNFVHARRPFSFGGSDYIYFYASI